MEENFNWNNIMELRVVKKNNEKLFYKTSHHDQEYKALSLKRLKASVKNHVLQKLNIGPKHISREKYKDLVSLCSGETPVVKMREHKNFYLSLPHD